MSSVSPALADSCRPRRPSSPLDASLTSGLVHSARWPQMSSVYNVEYTHFFGGVARETAVRKAYYTKGR
jgi:hypothetical protein